MALTSALNGLSSISALSLSEPEAIAGLVTLGIVATGAVVAIAHKKWENYEEKKHRNEIEDINRRYKHFLERIEVPGYGVIQGFPPIFKWVPENNPKSVDSLHYTVDEIKEIGRKLPQVPPALSSYRQSILHAILKLKEYYLSRENHNDTTAGVLSYLLNILQNRCLSFEGYDFDSAYLGALTDFIDDYASMEGRENSQHFKRLQPVYTYLLDAKQHLDKHKESLSLRELINELRETCLDDSNRLLRLFVKTVVPEKKRDLADTAALDELENNIVRREYIKSEVWGAVLSKFHEINLPESVFKDWIIGLAAYYLKSLRPCSILKDKKVMSPTDLFAFTDWAQAILRQNKKSTKDKEKLSKQLEAISQVFNKSRNFINTKRVGPEKKPEFVVVEEDQELLDRTVIMAHFAHLIHAIISLQAFCSHLLHSIEQLGAIYINDPQHFTEIFTVLDNLCKIVDVDLHQVKEAFVAISKANKNTMRLANEGLFPKEIATVLESVEHMLLKLGAQVKEYKNQHAESSEAATKTVVYEMLAVAQFFEKMYTLPQSIAQLMVPVTASKNKSTDSQIKATAPTKPILKETIPPEDESLVIKQKELALYDLGQQIRSQIDTIHKEQPSDSNLIKYQKISYALSMLKVKSINMLQEKSADTERTDKANKTYNLVLSLYQITLEFLVLPQQMRTEQVGAFIQKIQAELNDPENSAFIDKHRDCFPRFIAEHFGFFHTDTRNKLSALKQAYEGLQAQPG
ncbi:Uncharacterised protein [Legionella steigerwaltii]|uniref:Uncharacterized protein n=1 Tax=Legionella steigerwaltii TaxID=460 RepID=A0A378LCQ3_9GAMM|nr:hypothetical protein [Legionella steigerwaltii]KTD79532.1 hypothetical protein Lstg_0748 [Legionella steigerwaltii]STY24583.1 Uncharacterised protein [Legionella steigerwaltii]